jgi:hypothetical protein
VVMVVGSFPYLDFFFVAGRYFDRNWYYIFIF